MCIIFSYVIKEPPDGGWGALINGTWSGIIGQLVTKVIFSRFAPEAVVESSYIKLNMTFICKMQC